MITLYLDRHTQEKLRDSLLKAGKKEIGGILMAQHIGVNEFKIIDLTIQKQGTVSYFFRFVEYAIVRLKNFFDQNQNDYSTFNYIGEWHSHPSFPPFPSQKDDLSMLEIVTDTQISANFVILMIVKLNQNKEITGSVHTYLPNGERYPSKLNFCE